MVGRPRRLRPGLSEPLALAAALDASEGVSRLLLALHGYEDPPAALAAALVPLTSTPRWGVLAPTGSVRTPRGAAWFASQDGDVGPALTATLDATERLAAQVCTDLALDPARDLAVLGWSQGAAAALSLALRAGATLRPPVVIALAAWLPNEPDLSWDFRGAARSGLRVLLVHGRDDGVVGVEQGRSTARVLERSGVDVTWVELLAGHELDPLLAVVPDWLGS